MPLFLCRNIMLRNVGLNMSLNSLMKRMFKSETEYLLPVFLDDTKLSWIPETQGYLTNRTPYEVAVMFTKKINKDVDVELMKSELQQNLPTYEITVKGRNVRFLVQ